MATEAGAPLRQEARAPATQQPGKRTNQRAPGGLFDVFAVSAPGLEPIVARELSALGITGRELEGAGVAFSGAMEDIFRANLWLRSASRVVVRLAEFEAKAFHELERLSRKVPWEEIVPSGSAVRFRVTCRKSRLYHSDAVADRLADAVQRRVSKVHFVRSAKEDEAADGADAQLFTVRIFHDRCVINADSSGALLHQRGYRLASGKAPLRETIAAAMVLSSGWTPPQALLDPLCGSGTIPIESALIARRIAPGIGRQFAFMHWPDFDRAAWDAQVDRARSAQLTSAGATIRGRDRDAGVIASARENAQRAGVAGDVEFETATLSAMRPVGESGWVISNPPYGVRVGESAGLRDLYAQLGNTLRSKFDGWRVGILSADRKLEGQAKLGLTSVFETGNGGIPVRFLIADV